VAVDLDATIVLAHSEKEGATPTFKRTFGFHPLLAFRRSHARAPGSRWRRCCARGGLAPTTPPTRSPSSTPRSPSSPRQRATGCWSAATPGPGSRPAAPRQRPRPDLLGRRSRAAADPRRACRPAAMRVAVGHRHQRRSARWRAGRGSHPLPADTHVGWPAGMRVIARRERPHPGAQLRSIDDDGWRITSFATNTRGGRLAELELRQRMRARAEDRIRGLKTAGCGTCRCTPSPRTSSGSSSSARRRAAHLDPDPRVPRQHRPLLGTETAPPPRPARRRPARHQRRRHWLRLPCGWPCRDHHHQRSRPPARPHLTHADPDNRHRTSGDTNAADQLRRQAQPPAQPNPRPDHQDHE
jgi:hypothetical protein